MVVALITNLVKLAVLNKRKNDLTAKIVAADNLIESNGAELAYRETDEYAESYAREYLDMQGKDEIAFMGK
jgi:hypothetical protein